MEEIWKEIDGFDGDYMVSNLGRVKSVRKNIILKSRIAREYEVLNLSKNGKYLTKKVHRLVANAFIPNPDNLPQVNHKDENKTNNCVNNLEWCDCKYNSTYGTRGKRISQKQLNDKNKSKVVLQYTLEGIFIKEWKSIKDVQRNLGFDHTNISRCCRGKQSYAYRYIWKYKKEIE